MNRTFLALALLLLSSAGAAIAGPATQDDEAAAFVKWRAERVANLTSETGWLTLVGLYWFKDGPNTLGRARSNTIALDFPQLGARAGSFVLSGSTVRFDSERGGCVRLAGQPLTSAVLKTDASEEPTLLSCGTLQFYVIERGGKCGLRMRDLASRARLGFLGLDYFSYDSSWRVDARFEPYEPHRHVPIVNVLGMEIDMESPGAIVFEREGHEWRLDALLESPDSDSLFIMFADGTSGHETYGAGRFMYVPLPAEGLVKVDFNRAYSPPCAFTSFATCPLPPAQNRIALRVAAGELVYKGAGH